MTHLPIIPFSKNFLEADITPPGSKSITNRALILAALHGGNTSLTGALFSEDTRVMLACLKQLGFKIQENEAQKTIEIQGESGKIPNESAELYVANAGTAARFLTALLALKPNGKFKLDGSPAMRERPMQGLITALEELGCQFEFHNKKGHFPFTMHTAGITQNALTVDASASSQILSAILQIAPCIGTGTFHVVLQGETVSKPFVKMTCEMMQQFGASVQIKGNQFSCTGPYGKNNLHYAIEPDATAASYFTILPYVHPQSKVKIHGLSSNSLQGDTAFITLLSQEPHKLLCSREQENTFHISRGNCQNGFSIDFNAISDTFLTLAAITPLFNAGTQIKIQGIAHTRKQETDRVAAMAKELSKILGSNNVVETEDALEIQACSLEEIKNRVSESPDKTIHIETYNDHRIAMSFAILASFDLHGNGKPWLCIENPNCCAKTFPNFFSVLDQIKK